MTFEYGLYVPRDTFLHKLDPRAKFLLFLTVLSISVVFNEPRYIIGFAIAGVLVYLTLIVLGLSARLTLSRYLLMLANSTIFLIACLIFWPPVIRRGRPFFTLPFLGWTYTDLGFMYAIGKMFLIVNPITAALIIFPRQSPWILSTGL
jgi:energy-coupling factor transporter transmembrane protein EcfT